MSTMVGEFVPFRNPVIMQSELCWPDEESKERNLTSQHASTRYWKYRLIRENVIKGNTIRRDAPWRAEPTSRIRSRGLTLTLSHSWPGDFFFSACFFIPDHRYHILIGSSAVGFSIWKRINSENPLAQVAINHFADRSRHRTSAHVILRPALCPRLGGHHWSASFIQLLVKNGILCRYTVYNSTTAVSIAFKIPS